MAWHEPAEGVLVWRYPVLDVNVTLILGDSAAIVVDTLSTPRQASAVATLIRAVTSLPITIVNTHHHFDHCFGNAAFRDALGAQEIWAHETTAEILRERGTSLIQRAYADFGTVDGLEDLADVVIAPPTHVVRSAHTLDLGGRTATLRHLGRAHTAGDLIVAVDDVIIAGDLIEQGAAPSFEDSYPLEWPETVAALLKLPEEARIVPGHGAVVDREFAVGQHTRLANLDWLIRDGHRDGATIEAVAERAVARWPGLPAAAARMAVRRGYAQLAGQIC